jgi:hypothetical protein
MNARQRLICYTAAALVLAMGLYPPFTFRGMNGATLNLGYGWIFVPPRISGSALGSVDVGLLLAQWLGVLILAAIAFAIARDRKKHE